MTYYVFIHEYRALLTSKMRNHRSSVHGEMTVSKNKRTIFYDMKATATSDETRDIYNSTV